MPESSESNFLLEYNKEQSDIYRSSPLDGEQRPYSSEHPTAIGALLCMDGRVNLPRITRTPLGLIHSWRNLGGRFNFGWNYFCQSITDWQQTAKQQNRDALLLATYHFSRSNSHLGCKGWSYDTAAAITHTDHLIKEASQIFDQSELHLIRVGIETDEDALLIHGQDGSVLDLGLDTDLSVAELTTRLAQLFPTIARQILVDLLPLLTGNIAHIQELRANPRQGEELDHQESVLALGDDFDWLQTHNTALIIGPFEDELSIPIRTAAGLLWSNIESKRVDPTQQEIVLLTSTVAREDNTTTYREAIRQSQYLSAKAMDIIQSSHPELAQLIKPVVCTLDESTQLLTEYPFIADAAQF